MNLSNYNNYNLPNFFPPENHKNNKGNNSDMQKAEAYNEGENRIEPPKN